MGTPPQGTSLIPGVFAKAPEQHSWIFAFSDESEQLPPHSNSQVYRHMAAQVTQQEAYVVEAKAAANINEKKIVNSVFFIVSILFVSSLALIKPFCAVFKIHGDPDMNLGPVGKGKPGFLTLHRFVDG